MKINMNNFFISLKLLRSCHLIYKRRNTVIEKLGSLFKWASETEHILKLRERKLVLSHCKVCNYWTHWMRHYWKSCRWGVLWHDLLNSWGHILCMIWNDVLRESTWLGFEVKPIKMSIIVRFFILLKFINEVCVVCNWVEDRWHLNKPTKVPWNPKQYQSLDFSAVWGVSSFIS